MLTADLDSVIEAEGQFAEVGGNRPFPLDDPETIWFIRSGKVEVFAENAAPDGAGGARRHLFRVRAGQVLLGVGRTPAIGLLAVAGSGTKLARLSRRRLCELAADPVYREVVSHLLEEWIVVVSQGLGKGLPPKSFVSLEAGEPGQLEEGECARPARGLLWVRHADGTSLFLGRDDVPPVNGKLSFPLSGDAWLAATGPGELSCRDTADWLSEDAAWAGLDHFHEVVLRCVGADGNRATEALGQRLEAKATSDRAMLSGALSRLSSVLDKEPAVAIDMATREPLLAACRLVGSVLGAVIVPYSEAAAAGQPQRDHVENIARASHLRKRRVALRGHWWREENGPLVAFMAEDKRPVALLPTSPTSYELHDPVRGTRTRVTAKEAQLLEPFAYRFYRTLPMRALRLWDLLHFAAHNCTRDLVRVVVIGIIGGILGTIAPLATGMIFESIIPRTERFQLLQICLGLALAGFAGVIFQIVRGLAMLRLSGRMETGLEAAVWDRVLNLPSRFFREYPAGDLAERAMGVSAIHHALTSTVLTTLLGGLMTLTNLGVLFYYSPTLALVAITLVLIAVATLGGLGYLQVRQQKERLHWHGRISGLLLQLLNGIAKLRVAGAEDRAFAQWATAFAQLRRVSLKARVGGNVLSTFNAVFGIFCMMTIYAAVIWARPEGFGTGSFLGFSAAFGGLLGAALGLCSTALGIMGIVPMYHRMRPILETLPEVDETRENPGPLAGEIEVNKVTFRYSKDGPAILDGISLRILPGEFVALVGASGCGKSTLLRMLLGFETPESGTVSYDGKNLSTVDLREVRRQIGVVLQNGRLLPGSIQENILGSFDLGIEDAWEAARMSGLASDIEQMPMGMQTMITEGASTLSGGQRQRLLIARALVNRPRILFFDEATSALDNHTQAIVSRSLELLKCTRVVIAHRLSTIENAARIFVLDKGRVVQSGNYEELMAQPGLFADLARRQLV